MATTTHTFRQAMQRQRREGTWDLLGVQGTFVGDLLNVSTAMEGLTT